MAGRTGPDRGAVLAAYTDGTGVVRRPPPEVVRSIAEAVAQNQVDQPCVVCLAGGRRLKLADALPLSRSSLNTATLHLESGGEIGVSIARGPTGIEGTASDPIPLGTHALFIGAMRLHVLARPRSLSGAITTSDRRLCVFLPLHAVRPGGPFGIGTYADLARLCDWASGFDGAMVGTLPLFPTFLDRPFDPSPYAPISRLMWSELFVDPRMAPEWKKLTVAKRSVRDGGSASFVDYRRSWSNVRRVLRAMARIARTSRTRWTEVLSHCNEDTRRYAEFRARVDACGLPWPHWPARRRTDGALAKAAAEDVHLYLYAQSLASQQMELLARNRAGGRPLYLDLPVGVHADGFDTFVRPDHFLRGFAAGAPPDALNPRGQNWGFPPLHPTAGRVDGYVYLRTVLRRMLSVAGALRIDHVMGLYRMFCIPGGCEASEGAYLRYPEDELFAVVLIEAAKAGAVIVGEDLGTVPPAVRRMMRRFGMLGMHVQQFAFEESAKPIFRPPPPCTITCLNTHDTPTFAGFWHGDDIALRARLGMLDRATASRERARRSALRATIQSELTSRDLPARSAVQAARSIMRLQARGPAPIVLINLEDLWGERRPQNVPGTSTEYPNWRRKAAVPLRRVLKDRTIARHLLLLARERRTKAGASS